LDLYLRKEILHDLPSVFGQYGFRMELDAVYRVVAVHEAHDSVIGRRGCDQQTVGYCGRVGRQGMVACNFKRFGEPIKKRT